MSKLTVAMIKLGQDEASAFITKAGAFLSLLGLCVVGYDRHQGLASPARQTGYRQIFLRQRYLPDPRLRKEYGVQSDRRTAGRASGSRLKGASRTDIAKCVRHESIYITLHYSHAFKSVDNDIANNLDAQMDVLE